MTPEDEARVLRSALARTNVPIEGERGVAWAAVHGGAPSPRGH